jgi:FkbH-like protein
MSADGGEDQMSGPVVKCVIWDLDDTLWEGTLAEGDAVRLPRRNRDLLRILDEHGLLQSVASRNDPGQASARLSEFGIGQYFLHPQIGWTAKSVSVGVILAHLDIAPESALFVDDSDFERAEVSERWPSLPCVPPDRLHELVRGGEVLSAAPSPEARRRRELYMVEDRRREYERSFVGPSGQFLRSLGMRLTVRAAGPRDLVRAAELTVRTHQLNTTGVTFTAAELTSMLDAQDHVVLVADLEDRFGHYGTIGLAVIAVDDVWTIRLLLMSCRVLGRNVGTAFVSAVTALACAAGAAVRAHLRVTPVNRQMHVAYRLMGFNVLARDGDIQTLALPPGVMPSVPGYVDLVVDVPGRGHFPSPARTIPLGEENR